MGAEQLQCSGRLDAATARLLGRQLLAERQQDALRPHLPPPLLLADPASRHKRCRAAPRGSDKPPRLHRVALLTPGDAGGLDWAQGRSGGSSRDEMRLTQRMRALLEQPGQQQQEQQQHVLGAQGQHGPSEQHGPGKQQLLFRSVQLEGAGGAAAAEAAAHSVLGTGGSARGAPPADVSLVTQLSIDRLPSLRQQCASWAGPAVAVVYAPLVGGRLAGLGGSTDEEVAALDGATPLDALAYIRKAYAGMARLKGEWPRRAAAGCGGHRAGRACTGVRLGRCRTGWEAAAFLLLRLPASASCLLPACR